MYVPELRDIGPSGSGPLMAEGHAKIDQLAVQDVANAGLQLFFFSADGSRVHG